MNEFEFLTLLLARLGDESPEAERLYVARRAIDARLAALRPHDGYGQHPDNRLLRDARVPDDDGRTFTERT